MKITIETLMNKYDKRLFIIILITPTLVSLCGLISQINFILGFILLLATISNFILSLLYLHKMSYLFDKKVRE